MSEPLVKRLSSQALLMGLIRLSHRDGNDPYAHLKDPGLNARMMAMRDEWLRRLNLQKDLSIEARHVIAHADVLTEEYPQLAEVLGHSVSRLRDLATQPFGN